MLGTRGIWHNGWKAATEHGPLPSNLGNFDKDHWQLFHTDVDRAEAADLSEKHPDKVKELAALWMEEAKKYDVLPLNDLAILEFIKLEYRPPIPPSGRYVYYPDTTEVPEASSASTHGRSFKIFAEVEFGENAQGVIVAQGSRFGGYSLFVSGGELCFVYNFLGIAPEQRLSAGVPNAGKHIVGVAFDKQKHGTNGESVGKMTLYVDDKAVAQAPFRTMTGRYSLCGEGLCVGRDGGDPVSGQYNSQFPFTGGEVIKVTYDLADDQYIDLERKFAEAMARD
jgi:arylsulfatase